MSAPMVGGVQPRRRICTGHLTAHRGPDALGCAADIIEAAASLALASRRGDNLPLSYVVFCVH